MNARPAAGYAALRVLFGLTLAAAAGSKANELVFDGSAVPAPLGFDRLPPAVFAGWVVAEFVLGAWLVSGARAGTARWAAVGVLLVFSVVTTSQVVAGKQDCRCFGSVGVPPATTLAFDLTVLAGFLILTPRGVEPPVRRRPVVLAVATAAGFAVLPPLLRSGPEERFEVVDPSDWVGRRFPLIDDTDLADRLRAGSWLVVLYRPGCEECQRELPRFTGRARAGGASVALVEVPTAGTTTGHEERAGVALGHLRPNRTWVVRTPLAVWLRDGVVTGLESGS